jgi:hypothetical protein
MQENREKILKRERENKTTCNCGSIYRSRDRAQHLKTNKHINYENKKDQFTK